jgi:hypothetical protein
MLLGVSLPVSASGSQFAETLVGDPNGNGYLSLWEINASSLIGRACAATGDSISAAQWSQYVPGQPCRPPCQAGG